MCLNYNNNITVASFTGATAMTRVSTSGQCTYLYKVRQTPKDTRTGCQLFQSTYLYKVRPPLSCCSASPACFNPRTYIRYDFSLSLKIIHTNSFNPRTNIRYDEKITQEEFDDFVFQSTYLYKVRHTSKNPIRHTITFQSTYLYKVRLFLG